MCIVQDYLDLTKKYKAEYGEQTLLLMEVGSFFEVYALIKPDGDYNGTNANAVGANGVGANGVGTANGVGANAVAGLYIGSNIAEFSKINDLVIAKKSTCVGKLPVVMAGFGTAFVDKYIQKMQDHGYTIVIYRQDINDKTKRNLSEIISPGTYFPQENDTNLTNNVMCIWMHKAKATKHMHMPSQITIGIATIDIYTGKTSLFQFQTEYNHSPATYDELERYISAYRPNECLFVANLPERLIDDIIGFTGLEETKIHKVYNSVSPMATFAQNAEKQVYQVEIFKRFFPHLSSLPDMFPTHYIAIQSFCFLLDFVYQHCPNLTKKLTEPVFENYSDRLILSNHSLSQLNIIDDVRHTGKLRSVSALLNNCVTTIGQRQFLYQLHYPSTQPVTLQASYDITEHLLHQGETYFHNIRHQLNTISDLEKFRRKVVLHKILPKNLSALADDLQAIERLYQELLSDTVLQDYLKQEDIAKACREIITDLERVFNLDSCRNLSELDESQCIINKGISLTLDMLLKNSMDGGDKLLAICNYLSSLIQQSEKKTQSKASSYAKATTYAKATMYVKIHETAKSHATLVCTSRRALLLKAALKKQPSSIMLTYQSNYSQTQETFELDLQAIDCIVHGNSKSEMVITSKQIREITSNNEENQTKLVREMNTVFQNYITTFAQYDETMTTIIRYVMEMDLLQCKAYTAHKYNYCKPVIAQGTNAVGKAEPGAQGKVAPMKSFFQFTGIRHPLIEHLQTNELYVTNDLALSTSEAASEAPSEAASEAEASGLLLYGTNAVGKTSFIKSVGIAIIMAQAGLYVPCNTFTYQPYRNVFTRILGNDNLFKGLSTFAVEMTELRTILTMADAHSLVLGDELCSGTESDSALSIFTAGLEILHQRESTFLFATHFHEINKYDEITDLKRLKMMHMAVHFNKEKNLLIYDRKLREGSGESMYGLEVCKSLNLPEAFLQRAHDIRMKYNPEKQNMLSLSPTHFNAKKLVANCELCQKHKASEVHHLQHQKKASTSNEYILNTNGQNFHKNHVANLLNICESCHKKIHKSKEEHKVMKTNEGYILSKL